MEYRAYTYGGHITVAWEGDESFHRGTAEADRFPYEGEEGRWHIARVLVQPDEARGQGVGAGLLQMLKQLVRQEGGTHLTVDPGGYNVDPERQRKFYLQNGFTVQPDTEYRLVCQL